MSSLRRIWRAWATCCFSRPAPVVEEFKQFAADACAVVRIERGKRFQSHQFAAQALSLGIPATQGLRY